MMMEVQVIDTSDRLVTKRTITIEKSTTVGYVRSLLGDSALLVRGRVLSRLQDHIPLANIIDESNPKLWTVSQSRVSATPAIAISPDPAPRVREVPAAAAQPNNQAALLFQIEINLQRMLQVAFLATLCYMNSDLAQVVGLSILIVIVRRVLKFLRARNAQRNNRAAPPPNQNPTPTPESDQTVQQHYQVPQEETPFRALVRHAETFIYGLVASLFPNWQPPGAAAA